MQKVFRLTEFQHLLLHDFLYFVHNAVIQVDRDMWVTRDTMTGPEGSLATHLTHTINVQVFTLIVPNFEALKANTA